MKKLISLILALVMILSLAACGEPAADEGAKTASTESAAHEIAEKSFPFYLDTMNVGEEVKLYFLDGVEDLPYVELNDWMGLVNMLNMGNGYELTLETDGAVACFTREEGSTMVIDFDEDTFRFPDYNLFMKYTSMSTLLDFAGTVNVNDDGENALLKKSEEYSFERYGDEKEVRLGDYNIDLITQDGLYLVPLQTMSDFALDTKLGNNLFFNGQVLILAAGISQDNEVYYAAPTGERSKELTEYGYNELCLMLDSFYGLKGIHEIESFDKLFDEIGFKEPLLETDPVLADKLLYTLINKYIDDLHSKFVSYSYLSGPNDYKAEDGPSRANILAHINRQKTARAAQYPDGVPGYEEVGNTAYITFDNFELSSTNLDDYYNMAFEELPMDGSDTVALVIRAHERITREGSPIQNVVIDLSSNTGGTVDTAAYLLAWCLGKASVSIKDNFTGAMANTDYWADVNLDREFDEKDTITDKNIYCLISPVSFSCGNLVPNFFKQSGKVTLLGRTSGGGSCLVYPASTAWGTSINISAPRRVSFLKNGSLYDIDRGADPDYTISTPEKYYDRQALTDYINTLY